MLIQPEWINLLHESFYYTKMKEETKIYRVKDVLINPWPLRDALPDMVYSMLILCMHELYTTSIMQLMCVHYNYIMLACASKIGNASMSLAPAGPVACIKLLQITF